jgi:hypothetical protein
VSCTSPAACVAVGVENGPGIALRWNGTSWSAQTLPSPSGTRLKPLYIYLSSVSAPRPTIGSRASRARPPAPAPPSGDPSLIPGLRRSQNRGTARHGLLKRFRPHLGPRGRNW